MDSKTNPFGDELISTYSYDEVEGDIIVDELESEKSKFSTRKLKDDKILMIFAIAVFTLALSVVNYSTYSDKKEVYQSIHKVNEEMVLVSKIFSSEDLLGNLRDQSRSHGDPNVEQHLADAADAGRSVADKVGKIEPQMSNDEAKLEVYNYYKLCEAMNNIPPNVENVSNAKSVCLTFSTDAEKMMQDIKMYNKSRESAISFLSFLVPTPHLPDVTSYEK